MFIPSIPRLAFPSTNSFGLFQKHSGFQIPSDYGQLSDAGVGDSHPFDCKGCCWVQAEALFQAKRIMADGYWMSNSRDMEPHDQSASLFSPGDHPMPDSFPDATTATPIPRLGSPSLQTHYGYSSWHFDNAFWPPDPRLSPYPGQLGHDQSQSSALALPYSDMSSFVEPRGLLYSTEDASMSSPPFVHTPPASDAAYTFAALQEQPQHVYDRFPRPRVDEDVKRDPEIHASPFWQARCAAEHRATVSPTDLRADEGREPEAAAVTKNTQESSSQAWSKSTKHRKPLPASSPKSYVPIGPSTPERPRRRKATPGAGEKEARSGDVRSARDEFLVRSKRDGMTYREIRIQGGFTEAESTLRGRYRTLTKTKEARVRKPEWSEGDIVLLRKAVRKHTKGHDPTFMKVPWKQVAKYIADNGGSYHFGNATCRKKWDELVQRGSE
ncbi:uncharacterized protein DNG_03332 [Cephalotrichum gorgonifer]|uniref:Myb-like domain-containing protein n=1 Tax=Cephalotrichum gorgonifer TaxID=2041049 RepID=A0AAE8STJ2_9PEZI|nr:uncharacterized protein DNG_03332 [Cephalotrichum gorgonifer]